ncbi:uncharacterized protein LOC143245191 isoform X2 [Tachypleus tridentatus]
MIQCADFENKDVKSLIETDTITNTEPDDSLVNTILRTTAKTTNCMIEDNYYTQDAEKHLLTHNNIDSKEYRVLNLYENCRSVEQNTSVGLYNESCPHEHKVMRLTEDLEFDKNNFKHASDTNDISLMKETENKDYNSYLNNKTDNQHDITEREVEIEDDKNPKEVKLDDDVTPSKVEIEHDVIPKDIELDDNVTPRTEETEHNVIPKDIELDDDVTPRTVEIEHDVIPKDIELDDNVTPRTEETEHNVIPKVELDDDVAPRTVEIEHDVIPKEVEIKYDVVLRDAVIENDVLPDNGKIECNVISDEAETDCDEMSKYTEIIEQKKLCSDNIQDEKIVKPNNIPNLVHEDRVSKEHDVVHGQHVKSGSPVSDVDRSRMKQETTTKKQSTSSSKSQHIEKVVTHKDSHGQKVTTSKQSEQSTTRHYHEVNGVSENEKMSSLTETQKKNISIVEKEPLKEVKPSVDRAKVTRTFSQSQKDEKEILCRICGQHVYLMDKIKAEKSAFHKSCFRCKECGKTLNVDTYSSHEGQIYCKPHFKQLFQPKAKFEEDAGPKKPRKFEMIIRENVPMELPPDVVRCDTKVEVDLPSVPDLSDIRSRFESPQEEIHYASTADKYSLQRSESVMQRLAKYQSAVSGQENGEVSSSSEEEDEDSSVVRESKKKEKVKFDEMSTLKSQWESGKVGKHEGRGDDKKEELSKLRQKICLGRSESMRAVYERACKESEGSVPSRTESINLGRDVKAVNIKEKFEKGDMDNELEQEKMEKVRREKEEDLSVFNETGTAAGARTLFKQIDATTSSTSPASSKLPQTDRWQTRQAPFSSQSSVTDADVVKCSDPVYKDDIEIDASQLTQRFKFFENYKSEPKERKRFQITPPRETKKEESPEREIIRDPNVVRSSDAADEVIVTDTAKKMLNKFKQLENQSETDDVPAGPKPVKRITPPREYTRVDDEREPSPELERDPNIIRCSYKTEDDITWEADRAKCLRAKFEQWQHEIEKENGNNEEEYMPEVDTAKNLRAKFEAIREESIKPREKPKPRVRRFV